MLKKNVEFFTSILDDGIIIQEYGGTISLKT